MKYIKMVIVFSLLFFMGVSVPGRSPWYVGGGTVTPVTYIEVSASPGASSANCVVTKPTNLAVGQLMIAHINFYNSSASVVAPEGWTTIIQQASIGSCRTAAFWKIAVQADVDASTFTFTGNSSNNKGYISTWTGYKASSPIGSTNSATGNGNTPTVSTITPAAADSVVILQGVSRTDSASFSGYAIATDNPASWVEVYDGGYSSNLGAGMAYGVRPATSGTGNGTISITANTQWCVIMFFITKG